MPWRSAVKQEPSRSHAGKRDRRESPPFRAKRKSKHAPSPRTYPEAAEGPPSATVLAALRAELPAAEIDYAPGPRLAARHPGSSVDPTPLFAFGHGLSYTTFAYSDLVVDQREIGTDGTAVISCTVRNTGARAGAEVVQLYLSDPVAQVVRPGRWLAGFARVPLEPGQARRITFRLHADRTSFTGRDPSTGTRVVEPGEIRVAVGGASDQLPLQGSFVLCGPERAVGPGRVLDTPAEVLPPIIERSNGAQ
jgi:hypothetical protein